jgi:hypothetical protein
MPGEYNRATLFLGEINTGTWSSTFGGVSKIEKIKFPHEFPGTHPERPDLSSKRAPHINNPATV